MRVCVQWNNEDEKIIENWNVVNYIRNGRGEGGRGGTAVCIHVQSVFAVKTTDFSDTQTVA